MTKNTQNIVEKKQPLFTSYKKIYKKKKHLGKKSIFWKFRKNTQTKNTIFQKH